jgi:hypothetical protein
VEPVEGGGDRVAKGAVRDPESRGPLARQTAQDARLCDDVNADAWKLPQFLGDTGDPEQRSFSVGIQIANTSMSLAAVESPRATNAGPRSSVGSPSSRHAFMFS